MRSASDSWLRPKGMIAPTVAPNQSLKGGLSCFSGFLSHGRFQGLAAQLDKEFLGHSFGAVFGDGVGNFVAQNNGQARFRFGDGQDPGVNRTFPPGRQKAFWFLGSSIRVYSHW
jgi:hypothetical protein